ncbi:MAG: hypothetical protein K2L22_08220 [Muribaculaceae bacterium]|nr:hypothetical protein [Muribaculaceae bacterium]
MKVTKALLFGFALIAGLASASAQDNLTVVLKDGTELTGYISRQRPGENFTFTTSKATVLLPNKEVKSIVDNEVKVSSLSSEWKQWAEDNDAFNGVGNGRTLLLSDIITTNGSINRVRILEKGAKVRYLELTPNTYSLNWDTIQVVRADKRPKLLLSGINRRYKLASGLEYEGQYIEEVPGETMSLLRDNGVIEVFNTEEVMKDNRFKINPNQTLLEQSDLIDIVQMKNGGTHRGVIFERNYSDSDEITNDYLLIQLDNGSSMSLNLADIVEYRKEKNPHYKPLTDIVLEDGQGAINRNVASLNPTKEISGIVTVDTDSLKINLSQSNPQVITAEFHMDNAKAQQLKLIRIRKYQDKKAKSNYYGFTFEDMVKNAILPKSIETSVNGISKIEYTIPTGATGIYGVYDPLTNKIIIFKISGQEAVG